MFFNNLWCGVLFIPDVCGLPRTFRRTLLTYPGSVWSDSLLRRGFQAHVPRAPAQETCRGELFPFGVVYCCRGASVVVVVLGCRLLLFWDVLGLVPSLVRQPRKLAEDRLCFHLFLFSLSVACHCFGVLVVIVLGCCLSLFWGLVCCFGAAFVVVVFKAL